MTRFRILTACGLLFAIVGSARADIADDLVAYWQLEDDTFVDSINDHHGEAQGTDPIAIEQAKFGNGIRLNGEDQFVEITGGDEADFDFVAGAMSISAWFTVDAFDTSWQALIAKGEGNTWRLHRRGADVPEELAWTGGNGDTDVNGVAVAVGDDVFHHVVVISDASLIPDEDPSDMSTHSARLYLDGELIGSKTGSSITNNDMNVMIGENPDARGREWEGFIDDVAIWGRVLTDDEIGRIWGDGDGNSIIGLLTPGLAGDFNGDEVVDLADFDIMVSNFNSPGKLADGDFDFNGQVNLKDFAGFREVFNAAPVGAAASVPEPSGLALMTLGALAFVRRRRVRQ